MVWLFEIAWNKYRFAPSILDQAFGLARVTIFVKVRDQDVGAFPCKCDRNRSADPTVCARDHGLLSLQPLASLVGCLTVVRYRRHRAGLARLGLVLLFERRSGLIEHGCPPGREPRAGSAWCGRVGGGFGS